MSKLCTTHPEWGTTPIVQSNAQGEYTVFTFDYNNTL